MLLKDDHLFTQRSNNQMKMKLNRAEDKSAQPVSFHLLLASSSCEWLPVPRSTSRKKVVKKDSQKKKKKKTVAWEPLGLRVSLVS